MFRGGMVALVFNRTLNLPDYQAQGAALSLMSTGRIFVPGGDIVMLISTQTLITL